MNMRQFFAVTLSLIGSNLAHAADTLTVFSGRSDKFVKPVIEHFTQETGIQVQLHSGKSTGLLNKLRTEGKRTQADLFLSNDAGTLQKGSDLGLFAILPDSALEPIPSNYAAKDKTWVGLSARARVLVVNSKSKSAKAVQSVFDLAKPEFKNKLAITNSTNESYIAGATVYMLAAGKKRTQAWLEGMKSNVDGKVFDKHSKIVKAVASGKKSIGLVNHYYVYRHLAKHPKDPVSVLIPDQGKDGMGVAWNVAGIAISKHSKKKQLAQKLVEYLVSEQGQQQFAEENREYPTRKGVAASAEVPAAGSYKVADIPMYQLGTQRNATIDLLEVV
ncbi:MAG: extracellular solute-binding protein, partial [Gammaproteobacteria bacterium]|nr:extracellular solute-binding protein [Gammaproteobacteria bacterium]